MYIYYGMFNRDSIQSRGLMTNRKYVLGPGSDLRISPYITPSLRFVARRTRLLLKARTTTASGCRSSSTSVGTTTTAPISMGEVGVVLGCADMGEADVGLVVCETLMGVADLAVEWACS